MKKLSSICLKYSDHIDNQLPFAAYMNFIDGTCSIIATDTYEGLMKMICESIAEPDSISSIEKMLKKVGSLSFEYYDHSSDKSGINFAADIHYANGVHHRVLANNYQRLLEMICESIDEHQRPVERCQFCENETGRSSRNRNGFIICEPSVRSLFAGLKRPIKHPLWEQLILATGDKVGPLCDDCHSALQQLNFVD